MDFLNLTDWGILQKMTYQTKRRAGKSKGGKAGASFFDAAKKKLLNSTRNIKQRQDGLFHEFHSVNVTTKVVVVALLAVVAVIVVVSVTRSQISVSEKQQELDDLDAKIAQQELDNAELEQLINGDLNAYIEDYARDKLDMVKPGERVYINTVGD